MMQMTHNATSKMSAPCLAGRLLQGGQLTAIICRTPRYSCHTHIRQYARYLRRQPLKVLTQEEADNIASAQHGVTKFSRQQKPHGHGWQSNVTEPDLHKAKGSRKTENRRERFKLPEGISYETLEEGDRRAGPILMATKSRKMREQARVVLLEGKRLINDAIRCGATVIGIYFDKLEGLAGIDLDIANASLYKMRSSHLKIWSDVTTSQGIMAVVKMPKQGELSLGLGEKLPLTVICDNIRDPGNMGTILRSAGAVGCRSILVTKGCVDIWEPKVLRAGAGVHFRCPVIHNLGWEIIGNYLGKQSQIFLADNRSEIPQLPKKLRQEVLSHIAEADENKHREKDEETGQSLEVDESYKDETVELYKELPIPIQPYYEANFTQGEPVLVIGGETEGLSAGAHKLAFDRNGDRLHIPMMPGMESLNSSVAASVIMFEIQRQLLTDMKEDSGWSEM